jgi:Family of unknown function (DUF5719)
MSRRRRTPLLFALALVLIGVGVLSTLSKTPNRSLLPSALSNAVNAESTALYCTGLSGVVGPQEGHVIYLNTTNFVRSVSVQVVNDLNQRVNDTLSIPAHQSASLDPLSLVKGHSFAVEAQVTGGGVVAQEVTRNDMAEVPCASTGVSNWYGSGFDTLVGSSGELSIYNPTATPAVFNVATYAATGYSAPPLFQGLSVGAHDQMELNLGTQIVDNTNVGAHVSVLRGSIVIVGVQQSGSVVSLNTGSTTLSKTTWFPRVTTVANALAEIRITNPGPLAADVSAHVTLSPYKIAPQNVVIAPYSSGELAITPNPAIPASGYASVELTSNQPIFSSLASGTTAGISLWAPQNPSNAFLFSDFSGHDFDAATITNTSSKTVTVHFLALGTQNVSGSAQLNAYATEDILSVFGQITTLSHSTLLVKSSSPSLLVTTTLPSRPAGVTLVAALDGW